MDGRSPFHAGAQGGVGGGWTSGLDSCRFKEAFEVRLQNKVYKRFKDALPLCHVSFWSKDLLTSSALSFELDGAYLFEIGIDFKEVQ